MTVYAIEVNPEERYQIITTTLVMQKKSLRVRIEIRYLNETELWYLSMFDAQSGQALCRYVPLLASENGKLQNLLEPFEYKDIGCIAVIPVVDSPKTVNPGLDNLGEFQIVWGESFAE